MKINPDSWRLFFEEEERVLAIPSWTMPRVYLPSRSARQRWGDAGAFYPALRIRSKLVRLGFQFFASLFPRTFAPKFKKVQDKRKTTVFFHNLFKAGVQRIRILRHSALFQALMPDAYGLTTPPTGPSGNFSFSLQPWIKKLPEYDHAVVLVGAAADDKQKLIVRMEDEMQRVLAYMKYAEQPLAQQKLTNEQLILDAIPNGHGPEIMKFGQFGEGQALLMTTVPGKPLPSRMPSAGGPCGLESISRFVKALERDESFEIDEHPAICRIKQQVLGVKKESLNPNDLKLKTMDFEKILAPLRKQRWPVTVQHGDLTPWNLYEYRGRLCAVDWEDGVIDGFLGFDLVYFCVQTGYFLHQWPAGKVFRVAEAALQESLSREEKTAIVRLGALDAYLRGRADGMSNDHPLQEFRLEIVNLAASS